MPPLEFGTIVPAGKECLTNIRFMLNFGDLRLWRPQLEAYWESACFLQLLSKKFNLQSNKVKDFLQALSLPWDVRVMLGPFPAAWESCEGAS